MKLIDVIPLTKIPLPNPQILTYFTNKVNVERGGLVIATLGKRKIPAIVINSRLLEDEKMNIRKADFQLSPIKEILSAKPMITPEQLELAFWMHEYYYEPLGLILKAMLPQNIASISNFPPYGWSPEGRKFLKPELLQMGLKNSVNYFLKEIEKTLKEKKQVLILAPEINILNCLQKNITPYSNVGGSTPYIEILTSKVSKKQFREIWQKTAAEKIKVIFGTRKALFLPFRDLGLIILAEEHNSHYKSWDQHPKYHARETAKKLAELHNAEMIMQSETPSIETKFEILNSKSEINTKYHPAGGHPKGDKIQNTKYTIIDMREEIKVKNYSIFSRALFDEIKKSTEKKEKIILFINRRGEASAILCRDCGHIIKCKNCETPLVQHTKYQTPNTPHQNLRLGTGQAKYLSCHHCGYKENAPNFCPNCHGHRIKFLGGGTEKTEEELRKIFPEQKILRLDSDTTKTEKAKKDIIKNFNENNGILIGTQLMASSDVFNADFLGIINSDAMLNMPDFRSGERTFQTIVSLLQKVKNNGSPSYLFPNDTPKDCVPKNINKNFKNESFVMRNQKRWGGKIIYQTYSPDHYAIKYALKNDYENFYKEELKLRKLFSYPPFSQIIKLTFSHKNQQIAEQEAKRLYEKLTIRESQSAKNNEQKNITTHIQYTYKPENVGILCVIGPTPAFIPKQKNKYLWNVILKIPPQNWQVKNQILKLIPSDWSIDVDPESLL